MNKEELLEYEQTKIRALEELRSGKWLFGKDGPLARLFKRGPEATIIFMKTKLKTRPCTLDHDGLAKKQITAAPAKRPQK